MTEPGIGFDIALLGIDGIGKSSVAKALAEVLRHQGYTVTLTSWQQYVRADRSGRGSGALRAAYGAIFRSVYAACTGPDGGSADRLLPGLDGDLFGWNSPGDSPADSQADSHGDPHKYSHARLNDPDGEISLDMNRPGPFVAAGLMELAARIIERDFVIEPALARGEVVIQESHGLKNAVKLGMVAEGILAESRTAGQAETSRALEGYYSFAHRCVNEWSPPVQTVLLSGDPELAYRWRKEQNGRIPRGEHTDLAGRPDQSTFVRFQSSIQQGLVAVAESEGWPRVHMTDRARQENIDSAVRTTLDTLAERGLIPAGMTI